MNPLGMALLAYHSGNAGACFTITRDDGFVQTVPVKVFFEYCQFPDMEVRALDLCFETVLDEEVVSDPFDWLHLDFESLARHGQAAGWNCRLIHQESDGHYLAKIIEST
jgi:hypothetical protein